MDIFLRLLIHIIQLLLQTFQLLETNKERSLKEGGLAFYHPAKAKFLEFCPRLDPS